MIVFKGIEVYIVFSKIIKIFHEGFKFVICCNYWNNEAILYYHTCTEKEDKAVRFLTEIFYISFLYLCLCGGVLHTWEMTEI